MGELKIENFQIPGVDLNQILKDSTLVRNYANGFVIGRTPTDMFLLSTINSQPVVFTNISFVTAKKLLAALQKNITDIEKELGEIKEMPGKNKPV